MRKAMWPDTLGLTGKTDAKVQEALVKCENSISPQVSPFADPIYTMPDTHSITKCMLCLTPPHSTLFHSTPAKVADSPKPWLE